MAPTALGGRAKAEVWLDRHAGLRLAGADASAAGARGQRAGDSLNRDAMALTLGTDSASASPRMIPQPESLWPQPSHSGT